MTQRSNVIEVYLEIGKKKTFACAVDWPGWTRSGRDEAGALNALLESGSRYARALDAARLDFQVPADASAFVVIERLKGNFTTDFGTPDQAPTSDARPIHDTDLQRFQAILKACWRALDVAAESAKGKALRTGPRGGGRILDGILEHVRGSEEGYCSALGGKVPSTASQEEARSIILEALAASARGEFAELGPRGRKRWLPRYFVRRVAWHVLDHAWEIEDRID